MSRMKHLLRKLHIGGCGVGHVTDHHLHHCLPDARESSSPTAASLELLSPILLAGTNESTVGGEGRSRCDEPVGGFNFLEEEYQVQLALALSASDADGLEGPDSVQMKAATQMSLGSLSPVAGEAVRGREEDTESLSLRYWNYNIVDYHEKLVDGFYVTYGITSSHNFQGQMPSLVDLQATPVSESIDYGAVIVNRVVDQAVQQLERRAMSIYLESRVAQFGPIASGLIQKIADLVVDSMGGPVGDADDILRRWTVRSSELRTSLKSIVLPLGSLGVGLSCHRALLFKVLADRINLPCRLVKGSYYTGTNEGAINLIKVDFNSQFILDLMGAPGVLIPAENLSDYFQTSGPNLMSSSVTELTAKNLCLEIDKVGCQSEKASEVPEGSSSNTSIISGIVNLQSEEKLRVVPPPENFSVYTTQRFEHEFGELPPLGSQKAPLRQNKKAATPAQQMKVNDVSKYVVDAAKDPDFAQKLHAVLMESCESESPDLFSGLNPSLDPVELKDLKKSISMERKVESRLPKNNLPLNSHLLSIGVAEVEYSYSAVEMAPKEDINVKTKGSPTDASIPLPIARSEGLVQHVEISNLKDTHEADSSRKQIANVPKVFCAQYNDLHILSNAKDERNPILNGAVEWEIPWEDLQIGERIGIGSYGEVYRADWNGTEVAVKKFLDQDLSGDALEQVRFEINIMLRLRHPNVILFMGAVTCPPNLSILTEFLPRGSLYRLLHRSNVQLDEKRRMKMALDVAKGMNYLHTSHPTIVHRDLKSPNLLVDKNWIVKVCDFGLSQLKQHTFLSSKSAAGTAEWMAPEVLRNEPSNEKCDVYSFGVILWELATLRMPWSGINSMQVVGAVGFQNRRLDIPKEINPIVADIISDCWHNDPNQRPSFAQLLSPLKQWKRLVVTVKPLDQG